MESEIYKKMYENEDKFWWNVGMRKIAEVLLNKYLKKQDNKILDIGCGTGGMFKVLSKYGKIWGIDRSKDAVHYARLRNYSEEVVEADIDKLPFENNFFDVTVCFDVLYHKWVKDDVTALKEMNRVLKSGGILVIREASYNWLRSQHDKLVWTNHRFNKKELVMKLEQAGFKVEKKSYVLFFLFPLALVKRLSEKILPKKDPLNYFSYSNILVNIIFKLFLYIEAQMIKYWNFPFGLSIICIARK